MTSSGCFAPSDPIAACPAVACPVLCSSLAEATCRMNLACRAETCPDCRGTAAFVQCSAATAAPITCRPAAPCPPAPCPELTTLDECEARADCHSVFVDPGNCDCLALGCCARFARCAPGATALCKDPGVGCEVVTPFCEGPYMVSYTATCYEGCVQQRDCAP
jgi:hypothetical protein